MTLNWDLIRSSSAGANSFAVRKSSAVPMRKMSLNTSFSDGVPAAARRARPGPTMATALAARNSLRETILFTSASFGAGAQFRRLRAFGHDGEVALHTVCSDDEGIFLSDLPLEA